MPVIVACRRDLEHAEEEESLILEGNIGGGLVLRRQISILKDNPKILQIDSGIIARSVGAGSGGFSRLDETFLIYDDFNFFQLPLRGSVLFRLSLHQPIMTLSIHHMEILFNCFSITATYLCDRICHLIVLNKLTRTLENYEARQHAVQKLFYSFLPVDTF